MEGGGRTEIIYVSALDCHHQNDSCIKMGSDESHFNVSLIVRDKVTRQFPQTTTFEEKGEPKPLRTEVPLLTARPNRLTCICGCFLTKNKNKKRADYRLRNLFTVPCNAWTTRHSYKRRELFCLLHSAAQGT